MRDENAKNVKKDESEYDPSMNDPSIKVVDSAKMKAENAIMTGTNENPFDVKFHEDHVPKSEHPN